MKNGMKKPAFSFGNPAENLKKTLNHAIFLSKTIDNSVTL